MPYMGFLGDPQADWTLALNNVHDLALTIGEAERAGQYDAVTALQPQWEYWVGQLRTAAQVLYGAEMPGGVMRMLDTFSDFSLFVSNAAAGTTQSIIQGATADVGGVAKAAAPLLWPVAIVAATVLVVLYGGKRGKSSSTPAAA